MEDPDGVALVTMYAQLFVAAQLVVMTVIVLAAVISVRRYVVGTTRRRCAFRCAIKERDVEVELTEHRLFGVVEHASVTRCSAFESPEAVECGRRCVNPAFRRQWLPSGGH
jgi:hypothetical protein